MKYSAAVVTLLSITTGVVSAQDDSKAKATAGRVDVDRYGGPKECDDENKVQNGKHVKMHYTGSIHQSSKTGEQGKKFDSSLDRGATFDFQIGVGQVIKGWDIGLLNLCIGAKANIVIPPEMGYGDEGAGSDIPGGATLNFDVEVVDVSDKAPPGPNLFKEIDGDSDGKLTKEEVEKFFQAKHGNSMPDGLWENEDKDKNGWISWDEFGGSKGDPPSSEEL